MLENFRRIEWFKTTLWSSFDTVKVPRGVDWFGTDVGSFSEIMKISTRTQECLDVGYFSGIVNFLQEQK